MDSDAKEFGHVVRPIERPFGSTLGEAQSYNVRWSTGSHPAIAPEQFRETKSRPIGLGKCDRKRGACDETTRHFRRIIGAAVRGQGICREPQGACVATSASPFLPSLSWSTSVIVRIASAARACPGAAPRIFRAKAFGSTVRTGSIPARARPAPGSIIISVRPAGPRCAGRARPAPRDLAFRLAPSPIRCSRPRRCRFGKSGDTNGRQPWTMWRIGTRNRHRAEAAVRPNDQPMRSSVALE